MDLLQTLKHKNLLFAALADLVRRSLRSVVAALCLATALLPLITALAISEGLEFQGAIGVHEGADVYISGDLYGAEGPISLSFGDKLRALPGVDRVTSRVVGRTYFVNRLVAVVGIEGESLQLLKPLVEGTIPESAGDVVVGRRIADEFGVERGMRFTIAANPRKTFRCTGTLAPSCLWGSHVLVMHQDDANAFFKTEGMTSQFLVYGRAGSGLPKTLSAASIRGLRPEIRVPLHIKDRDRSRELLQSGFDHRGGIFIVLLVVGGALAISAFLVTSGLGLRETDKEIGVLKAMGWRTMEILEKTALENLIISLSAVSIAVLFSMVWIKVLNGMLIAQFYIAEIGLFPEVEIPSRYLPSHALLGLAFALVASLAGGLSTVWKKTGRTPHTLVG